MQHHVRECGVGLAVGQWQRARLAVPEFDLEVGFGCSLAARGVDHTRRVVDRYHPHPEAREFDRQDARARADVCDDQIRIEESCRSARRKKSAMRVRGWRNRIEFASRKQPTIDSTRPIPTGRAGNPAVATGGRPACSAQH